MSAGRNVPGVPAVLLGGRRNALSAARTLGRYGVEVFALPDRGDCGPVASRYVRQVHDWPPSGSDEAGDHWLECLDRDSDATRGAVLVPCSDDALEFLALHRSSLRDAGYRPVPANDDAVLDMLDKGRTYELARKANVPAPHTAAIGSVEELRDAALDFSYPCALKPVHSHRFQRHFPVKAFVAENADDLEQRFEAVTARGVEMLLTEIVPGADDQYWSYYAYLEEDGRPLVSLTKRKLRQHPIGFGLGTYHMTTLEPEAAELGLRFARTAGLVGLVNVEFKRDSRDHQLKLIECNVRLTAANELVRRAGIDLARIIFDRALDRPFVPPVGFRQDVYEWHPVGDFQALRQYRAAGQMTTRRWIRSLVHRGLIVPDVAFDDLRPLASKLWDLLRGRV